MIVEAYGARRLIQRKPEGAGGGARRGFRIAQRLGSDPVEGHLDGGG